MKKKKGKIYHKSHAVQKVLLGSPTLSFLLPVQMSLHSPSISHDHCNSAVFPTQHSTISPCFTVPIPTLTHLFSFSPCIFSHHKSSSCFSTLFHDPAFLLSSPSRFLLKLSFPLCIFHLPSAAPC